MIYFGLTSGYRPLCSSWWGHYLNPKTYYKVVKWFLQRGYRGWADCDVWSLDTHLNDILPGMIRSLIHGNSYPAELSYGGWKKILEQMASGFEAGNKKDKFCYGSPEREELDKEFDRGMELFVRYYNHLWD